MTADAPAGDSAKDDTQEAQQRAGAGEPPARFPVAKFIGALVLGLAGVALLVSLGVWQVHRLAWKEAAIARIEARIGDAPVPLPAAPDPVSDDYLAVRATGTIGSPDLRVLYSAGAGPGYLIVSPFETGGRRVLLERGFVPEDRGDAPRPGGEAEVTGNLHWPDDKDSFTPVPDLGRNIWFARDVPAMAAALGAEPVFIIARAPTGDGIAPVPVNTANLPNSHFGYAVTWFGLAIVWAGMTGLFLWRISRRAPVPRRTDNRTGNQA